jgi:hypothetical protein
MQFRHVKTEKTYSGSAEGIDVRFHNGGAVVNDQKTIKWLKDHPDYGRYLFSADDNKAPALKDETKTVKGPSTTSTSRRVPQNG